MINEDPKDALLRKYKEEIEQLRLMLEGGAGVSLEGSSGVGVSVVESKRRNDGLYHIFNSIIVGEAVVEVVVAVSIVKNVRDLQWIGHQNDVRIGKSNSNNSNSRRRREEDEEEERKRKDERRRK